MKRPLRVLGGTAAPRPALPLLVRAGDRLVSVADTGDGSAARRFADALLSAGGEPVAAEVRALPDARVVIRAAVEPVDARLHTEALEESADVVLGSARPAFASLLAAACARGVNS